MDALQRFGVRLLFLSTPSGWRATKESVPRSTKKSISIHALRVEGDGAQCADLVSSLNFYPRPPGGGRRCSFWG